MILLFTETHGKQKKIAKKKKKRQNHHENCDSTREKEIICQTEFARLKRKPI